MASTYELIIKATDKTSGPLKSVERRLKGLDSSATGSTNKIKGMSTALKAGGAAFAVLGAAAAAATRAVISATASYENTVNQLRLVTSGSDDFNKTIGRMTALARQNRTSFDSTVELYTKLKVATEELGYSTGEVEELTTKMSQALVVAGADAGTANGVIRQFGQAMASGVVRGDEFNSIVEGLGPALNIMARESGITVGKLREMANDGQLTADVFAKMLLKSNALDSAFKKLSPTVDTLEQQTKDSFQRMLVAVGEATGVVGLYKAALEQAGEVADKITASVQPKTELELLQEQAENARAEINRLKAELLTLGTGTGASADLMQGLGAFMNPDATQQELDRALRVAEVGSMPNGIILLNTALKDQEAILNQVTTAIDSIYAARKRDLQEQINQAVAAAESARTQREEEESLARTAAAYKQYAESRIEGARLVREANEKLDKQIAEQESLVRSLVSSYADTLPQADAVAFKMDQNEATIKKLNNTLQTNTRLTEEQKAQYKMAIAVLKARNEELLKSLDVEDEGEKKTFDRLSASQQIVEQMKTEQEAISDLTNALANAGEISRMLGVNETELVKRLRERLNALMGVKEKTDDGSDAVLTYTEFLKDLNEQVDKSTALDKFRKRALEEAHAAYAAGETTLERYQALLKALGDDSNKPDPDALLPDAERRAEVLKIFNLRVAEGEQNERIYQQLQDQLDLTKEQEEVLKRILNLGGGQPSNVIKPYNEALAEANKTFEFNSEKLAQNKKIFDELSKGMSADEKARLRGQLGLPAPTAPKKEPPADPTLQEQIIKRYQDQNKELEELQAALANVSELSRQAGVSEEFLTQKLKERIEGLDVYKDKMGELALTIEDAFKRAADSLADNMADAIVEGKNMMDVFRNAFKSVLKDILGAIIKSGIQKAMAGLFGGGGGMLGGLFGGGTLLGGLFGGFLATGGTTNPAKGYVVGEKGPEFFMPGTTGRVIPNDELGGGGTPPVVNFNINAIDTQTGTEFILKNKKQIEGVVNEAYHRRGKAGIV